METPGYRSAESKAMLESAARVVVKVGTGVVAQGDGNAALGRIGNLCEQIADLRTSGRQVVLVSSGAFGLGARRLNFEGFPKLPADRQICASVGQVALISLYDHMFGRLGVRVSQVLLNHADFIDLERVKRLTATIGWILAANILPVVNENDPLASPHKGGPNEFTFRDNDKLAALVATAIDADVAVILSDVPGVLTAPPDDPASRRVSEFTRSVNVSTGGNKAMGRGGVSAKIDAALFAAGRGVPTFVADGNRANVLVDLLKGLDIGTLFPAFDGSADEEDFVTDPGLSSSDLDGPGAS